MGFQHNEKELIAGCKKSNPAAQQEFYALHAPMVRAVTLRYLGNLHDANDVEQEIFIKIFLRFKQFKGDGSLKAWVKKIAVTTCLNYIRDNKKNRHNSLEDVKLGMVVEENQLEYEKNDHGVEYDFSRQELFDLVKNLPEEFRVVFNLFFIENYSHKEITNLTGLKEVTSRTRLHKAKILMQKQIEDYAKEKQQKKMMNEI